MRTLFLLRGAPAAGKSTWVTENDLDGYTLSADRIRLMCESPATNVDGTKGISQRNDAFVWKLLLQLLEKRMDRGEFVIVDATHYKSVLINQYKDLVDKYRYRVYVVDFTNITEEELLRRNAARGYKKVPDDAIRKMVVALADRSEIKSSYKIISPDEAVNIIKEPLKPVDVTKEKVVVFGDIHGCIEPLKEYFEKNPFNEDTCYIFCGDYIDRGIQNKETLEFLLDFYKNDNVILLEGNHERWLREYSRKDYDIENFLGTKEYKYKDLFFTKAIGTVRKKIYGLNKYKDNLVNEITIIEKAFEKEKENDENVEKIYFEFELVDPKVEIQKRKDKLIELETQINKLNDYCTKLKECEKTSGTALNEVVNEYSEIFGENISLDIRDILMNEFKMQKANDVNPIRSEEFMNQTYYQIKNLDKSELRQLCRKFSQLSYFKFNDKLYLVTHAGVPIMPTLTMATSEMIKGAGKYEDSIICDENFIKNCDAEGIKVISIHGHRNVDDVPAKMNDGMTYNLEGHVEHGGNLRILEIDKSGEKVVEIKNNVFKVEEKDEKEVHEYTDIELVKEMYKSPFVNVKHLKNGVISLNFNRDVFYEREWNELTCKARGLFVNKKNGEVVARSFTKFFNYNEVDETKDEGLKSVLKYPVIGYKKENGFLGIISKYKGDIFFFTKSSDEGDFVTWFKNILCKKFNVETVDELKTKIDPIITDGYSYIFECVDPVNDPHIISYDGEEIYLLEIMKNQMVEKHLPYDEVVKVAEKLNLKVKEKSYVFNSWDEFNDFKNDFRNDNYKIKEEGFVFEDANGFRVKFKSNFYSFWKQMRTVKEIIQKGGVNKKIYKSKEEIEVVKYLEKIDKDELKQKSIIDIEKEMNLFS